MSDGLLRRDQVAKRLGRPVSWLYRNIRKLEDAGFPKPLPVINRWDAAAIDKWIAGKSAPQAIIVPEEVDYGALLDARAAEMAQSRAGR